MCDLCRLVHKGMLLALLALLAFAAGPLGFVVLALFVLGPALGSLFASNIRSTLPGSGTALTLADTADTDATPPGAMLHGGGHRAPGSTFGGRLAAHGGRRPADPSRWRRPRTLTAMAPKAGFPSTCTTCPG